MRPTGKTVLRAATEPTLPEPEGLVDILDTMTAAIACFDRRRRYRYLNPAYIALAGAEPGDILGRSVAQVRGRAHARHTAPFVKAALAGEVRRWDGWYDTHVGGRAVRAYYETVYAPWHRDGAVGGYFVLVRDLTALRTREEELTGRTAQLEAILANIADGVTIADAEERLILSNAGFQAMFQVPPPLSLPGTPREAFVRHRISCGILYPHESAAMDPQRLVAERTRRVRDAGGVMTEEIVAFGRHLYVRRCELADGTSVSTFSDFSARVEAERARARQLQAAREAQQMGTMAALLAGVAHELGNPLSIVSAHAELLAEEAEGTAHGRRAGAVLEAVRRCSGIVASLLATARHQPARREALDIRAAVAAALDLVEHRVRASGVRIEARLPSDVPQLTADPDQIVHLLANLVGNAVDMLSGRDHPLIHIEAAATEGWLVLRVSDNGPGIPPTMRERVFDPFFTTKPPGAGSGVGLALCRTIAQEHGGTIVAEATAGGGATFVVRLPFVGAPPSPEQTIRSEPATTT